MRTNRTHCRECNTPFPPDSRINRSFCDKKCAREWNRKEWRRRNPKSALGIRTCGTVAEINLMRVALDLITRGCQIYRAAFKGMDCDMLVQHTGEPHWYRIEVFSGTFSTSGTLTYPIRDMTKYDVAAVVLPEKIVYIPEMF